MEDMPTARKGGVDGEDGPEPGQVDAAGRGEQGRRQEALHDQDSEDHRHRLASPWFHAEPVVPGLILVVVLVDVNLIFWIIQKYVRARLPG